MYENFLDKGMRLVRVKATQDLSKKNLLTKSNTEIPQFDVKTVWFSKTLQNWKGLFITDLPDNLYYEVTYNGDKKETYIDTYEKIDNVCVKDED